MNINTELLRELEDAHTIIRNGLSIMTVAQKYNWAKINAEAGVSGEGATRANERMDVIETARGLEAAHV